MEPIDLLAAPLGEYKVEAFCATKPGRRWWPGTLVGRTREENPRFDVVLDDRTVLSGLTAEQLRVA